MKTFLAAFALSLSIGQAAPLKVASLHPIVADLARQVGGAHVEVIEILKPGADIHHFEPASKDIAAMRGAKILLASGKELETYLGKLRDSLGAEIKLVEIGEKDSTLNPMTGARAEAERAASFYKKLGIADRFQFSAHPGGHEFDTKTILDFFDRHL